MVMFAVDTGLIGAIGTGIGPQIPTRSCLGTVPMRFIDETQWFEAMLKNEMERILRLGHKPPTELQGKFRAMPQVGFRGLKAHHKQALAELDAEANKLAARIDEIKGRGLGVIGDHKKVLDSVDVEINEMAEMVREGSNGAPL